jgi:hypothetical protein
MLPGLKVPIGDNSDASSSSSTFAPGIFSKIVTHKCPSRPFISRKASTSIIFVFIVRSSEEKTKSLILLLFVE